MDNLFTTKQEKDLSTNTKIEFQGVPVASLHERGLIGRENNVPDQLRAKVAQIQNATNNGFIFGASIVIPEEIMIDDQLVRPMLYLNEGNYNIPTNKFTSIPELVTMEDGNIIKWLVQNDNFAELSQDPRNLFIFPGNGGIYMREMLRSQGVTPVMSVDIQAKRQWGKRGDIWCDVETPYLDPDEYPYLSSTENIVFIDDAICTGETALTTINKAMWRYKLNPQNVIIVTQTLAQPRNKQSISKILNEKNFNTSIVAAVYYGGERERPRLLSTGSVVRGLDDPQRFSKKNYPPQLIDTVLKAIQS